jgi:hypothetical protein
MPVSVSKIVFFLIYQIGFARWLRITWLSSVTRLHALHANDGLFLGHCQYLEYIAPIGG